jgi:hypothetical protein
VWSRGQPHLGGCHLAAALSTACQVGEEPLTLSVAPRAWPDRVDPTRLEAPRTASPTPSSKGAACSIQSAFHRQVAPKELAFARRFLVGTRHRCLGFAAEDPASGALSPPRCSRPEWLDPTSVPEVLHLGSRRAKRRLSTSAIYCDPRAHPTDRPNPAHRAGGRPPAQLSFRATVFRRRNGLRVAVRFTAQPIERSRARGLLSGDSPIERHGSSRRDRSRWELHPNPIGSDTSCRELVATPAGVAVAVGSLLGETG